METQDVAFAKGRNKNQRTDKSKQSNKFKSRIDCKDGISEWLEGSRAIAIRSDWAISPVFEISVCES